MEENRFFWTGLLPRRRRRGDGQQLMESEIMVRTLSRFPTTDRIMAMLDKRDKTGQVNPYLNRVMKQLPESMLRDIRERIERNGHATEEVTAPVEEDDDDDTELVKTRRKTPRNFWDTETWDRYTELVWRMRQNAPAGKFGAMCEKAMEQMPAHLRRPAHSMFQGELCPKLQARSQSLMAQAHEAAQLQERLRQVREAPSREQIIEGLTEDELLGLARRVMPLVPIAEFMDMAGVVPEDLLDDVPLPVLTGHVVQRMMERGGGRLTETLGVIAQLLPHARPSNGTAVSNGHALPVAKGHTHPLPRVIPKARVVVVGLKGDQVHHLKGRLADDVILLHMDKDRAAAQLQQCDIVVIWVRFVSHRVDECVKSRLRHPDFRKTRLVLHKGGLDTMAEAITQAVANWKTQQ